ncbi:hypothetical protein IEQ34_002641 [Dendrobium chrysotoxum]|uniref:Uncharacterized protein n=1 Tax=Dendrobium chrysotoxum TaxID=161865 RepID=A0AAV7HHT1_DENCH|nr:hypothetical protein IEQ34_002641 [Dendrobium chrysotoxum]
MFQVACIRSQVAAWVVLQLEPSSLGVEEDDILQMFVDSWGDSAKSISLYKPIASFESECRMDECNEDVLLDECKH